MSQKRAKIPMKSSQTMQEAFERFLLFKSAQGLKFKTLESYSANFHAVSKYIDVNVDIAEIDSHFFDYAIVAIRERGLSSHTIRSYAAAMKAFVSWCNEESIL